MAALAKRPPVTIAENTRPKKDSIITMEFAHVDSGCIRRSCAPWVDTAGVGETVEGIDDKAECGSSVALVATVGEKWLLRPPSWDLSEKSMD